MVLRLGLAARGVKLGPRRKVAMAMWQGAGEGYIHAKLEVDAEEALAFLRWQAERSEHRASLTALVGKAVGEALVRVPELNRTLVWDTLIPHDEAALSILVAFDGDQDVGWVKVEGVDSKSVDDLARELREGASRVRQTADGGASQGSAVQRLLPVALLRPIMAAAGWYSAGLGGSLRLFGIEPYPFGSAVITTAATFDIDEVYDARTPFGHVTFNVVVCRMQERAVVRDGEIQARNCFNLCLNADHRVIDAVHLGRALAVLREVLENPWSLAGLQERPTSDDTA
jgi:hypothetical protein